MPAVYERAEAEDVGFLRSIGCEYAQGFYYGEPMSERDVMSMLRVIRKSERKLQRRGYFRTKPKPVAPNLDETAVVMAKPRRQSKANGGARPAPGSPEAVAAALKVGDPAQGSARPRLGADLPAAAVRLRPRNPQVSKETARVPDSVPPQHRTMPTGRPQPQVQPTPLRPVATPYAAPPMPQRSAVPRFETARSMAAQAYQTPPNYPQPAHPFVTAPPTQPPRQPPPIGNSQPPNLDGLPPAIAASIAKLAGMTDGTARPDGPPRPTTVPKKVIGR